MSRYAETDYSKLPLRSLITKSKDYLGGTPVFTGTRVPVKAMFDYLERGKPLDEFLRQFRSVERDQAVAVLHKIGQKLEHEKI